MADADLLWKRIGFLATAASARAGMPTDLYECPQCSAPPAPWTDGLVAADGDERDEFWCQNCGWETPLAECRRVNG